MKNWMIILNKQENHHLNGLATTYTAHHVNDLLRSQLIYRINNQSLCTHAALSLLC